jgi:hypothetical protein
MLRSNFLCGCVPDFPKEEYFMPDDKSKKQSLLRIDFLYP